MSYNLKYTVFGATSLAAIAAAVSMLRSNVQFRGVVAVQATAMAGYWDVTLSVHEDV